ncbi:MAG: hypothetical protein ACJAW3_001116 [Lentimonas sp.]|jgi:hypothetical protein
MEPAKAYTTFFNPLIEIDDTKYFGKFLLQKLRIIN